MTSHTARDGTAKSGMEDLIASRSKKLVKVYESCGFLEDIGWIPSYSRALMWIG